MTVRMPPPASRTCWSRFRYRHRLRLDSNLSNATIDVSSTSILCHVSDFSVVVSDAVSDSRGGLPQGINQEIKDTGKRIELLQRQLDGGLLSKAPRPPKHATTRTLLQARESRFAAGSGSYDRLRGARAAAHVTSEVEAAAATRVQTVVRKRLARALLETLRRMRDDLAALCEHQPVSSSLAFSLSPSLSRLLSLADV